MKYLTSLCIAAAALGLALPASAERPAQSERGVSLACLAETRAEAISGTIDRVSSDGFVLRIGEDTLPVRTNDETEYLLDGEKAERAMVLRAGAQVRVEHKDGLASKVAATTAGG